jgi:hypothetical protein
MFIAAFGAASAILYAVGTITEGPLMMIAGPLLAAVDLVYRRAKRGRLVGGTAGGTFLFVPVWIWGVFWTALGAYYYARS